MMKCYAMLKDSFREAVDTKVFYVMVGLSLLVTLVTATLSFKPRSGEKLLVALVPVLAAEDLKDLRFERLMMLAASPGFRFYEGKGAAPLDGAPDGPDSPYRVTLVAHCKSEAEAAKLRAHPAEALERIRSKYGVLDELRLLTVQDARLASAGNEFVTKDKKDPNAKDVYFEADVQPTPVARRLWPHEPSLFFGGVPLSFLGELPLGMQLYLLEDTVVNGLGAWIAVLTSIIITAFFIPNMLRKGTIDLLLVKPIHRVTLLLYKFVGGLLFILLNTTVAVAGVWVALGLRSGVWAPSFLLTILVITAFFAILYAVSVLFAVLTQSPIAAILLTIGVWFVLWIVGTLYQFGETLRQQEERRAAAKQVEMALEAPPSAEADAGKKVPDKKKEGADGKTPDKDKNKDKDKEDQSHPEPKEPEMPFTSDNWFFRSVGVIHFVLPRTKDLDQLMSRILVRDLLTANQLKEQKIDDTRISWAESITVSGLFISVMLGLSCLRFATKDY